MPATIPLLQEGRYSIEQEFPYVENCFLFQAYDTQNETPVTIVEVPVRLPKVATVAQREELSAAFAAQAKTVSAFKHKSVVAVRSHFVEAGRHYLVTDRVDGVDLASVLADQKHPFTVEQTTAWADTILDALNMMHVARPPLVYRNLRPENVVLRSDGKVELFASGMFCCGEQAPAAGGGTSIAFSPLEQIWSGLDAASQKVIINKYDEASEKILKQDLDARSDIYSLGATLYKLITGETPVDALERSIEMIEGNADPLKSPNKLEPAIPVEVSDVIMKALEIRREYRFDSAAIMRQVLRTALVRVKERLAEEALVQKVSEHDVRPTVQNVPPPVAASRSEEDAVAQRLREAEEKRLEAERRAAEAERKLRETEAAAKGGFISDSFNVADLEDDVLGLLSPTAHTSEAPQTASAPVEPKPVAEPVALRSEPVEKAPASDHADPVPAASAVAESIARSVEPRQEVEEVTTAESSEPDVQLEVAQDETEDELIEVAELKAAAASFSSTDAMPFTETRSGGGLGLPAIAAAAVVLIIAVVGGWFYFGSGPAPAAETATEVPAASQPAAEPEQPARSAFQPEPAPAEISADQPVEGQTVQGEESPQKVAAAAPAKTKKAAPAPSQAPEKKKAVTVDDLINDN